MIRSLARRLAPWVRRGVGFSTFDHLRQLRRWPPSAHILTDAEEGPVVFVEPHYDDVAYSAGGTVAVLRAEGREVHLLSVFTGAPAGPLSPLARAVHATWPDDDRDPYDRRRVEAVRAARAMDIIPHELGVPEVIYRDGPCRSIDDIFDPTVEGAHDAAVAVVADGLADLVDRLRPAVLVLPCGIGAHYDHRVVLAAAREGLRRTETAPAVWGYEDFPYVANPVRVAEYRDRTSSWEGFALVDVTRTFEDRVRWAMLYEHQLPVLFGTPEHLRIRMHAYAASVGSPDRPHERFWRF